MARVRNSRLFTSKKTIDGFLNGPWSTFLSSLGLAAKTGDLKWRTGALVTPRLRLLYPLKDGVRVSEGGGDPSGTSATSGANETSSTWVADHLGLGARVEVTFGAPNAEATPDEEPARSPSPDALAFQECARVAAQINDPHIVHILEHGYVNPGHANAVPFIVTELLEGKSLRRRSLHGAASLAEVETLVVQACEALTKAHALGIIHGGLRPDCLYAVDVADRPFIKISGFGAPRTDNSEQTSADGASPGNDYASPERLLHAAQDDAGADLWALAVSAYELLTTTLPFEAPDSAGVTAAICNARFSPPSHYRADLPRGVDAWFARALAKDPAARFADANEFARGFEAALRLPALGAPTQSGLPALGAPTQSGLSALGAPTQSGLPALGAPSSPGGAVDAALATPDAQLTAEAAEPPSTRYAAVPLAAALPDAELRDSELPDAELRDSDLPEAELRDSELPDAELRGGALSENSLTNVLAPAVLSPAALSPATLPPAAIDGSLEMEDDDEDEKTVKWDAPSEWRAEARSSGPPFPRVPSLGVPLPIVPPPPVAIMGSVVPHPHGGAPRSVGAATPGVASARQIASARQNARTQRISRASLQAATIPPTLEPSMYMESPYIASIASALAVPSAPSTPETQIPRERFFTAEKTWLAALAFAAGVAVTWFGYDAESDASDEIAADGEGNIRTVSVDDLPRVEGDDDEELAIIRTSQLPRAPDDTSEVRQLSNSAPPRRAAPAPGAPTQRVQALAPTPPAAPVATKAATPARPKAAGEAGANCSPPYYFDKQGIQRLKTECLNAPVVVTGPYGAVMTTTVAAKTGAAGGEKPALGEKQARANGSCSPPYYFEGKIRRLKLECL